MTKQFGVIGYFAGQLHIRVRHTDSDLALITIDYLKRQLISHEVHHCKNGITIIEIIGDSRVLTNLKSLTIKKQINRLENKLRDIINTTY